MRLSEIGEKEIVNLNDGERFGRLADAELIIDEKYGKIKALQVRDFRTSGRWFSSAGNNQVEIPWSLIKKIGTDIIIFESADNF
ncbi:MAG: YlmC/YmxH family sporulation protein [Bacillota bacterium]|nr:YlmC/YmxH family sporulation protein [Bacillota bacterium]